MREFPVEHMQEFSSIRLHDPRPLLRHDTEFAIHMPRAGFRLFHELHGQTSLAANAQYWVGECQFRMGRYKEALNAFYNVVSYYPLSQKLAASTLKIGQTYTRLKDHEKARMMFERVVDQYPDSPEAEVARKAIEVEAAKIEPSLPPSE